MTNNTPIQFPPLQERVIRSCQGRDRRMVRYLGQSRWYRGVCNAQIAWQQGDRP